MQRTGASGFMDAAKHTCPGAPCAPCTLRGRHPPCPPCLILGCDHPLLHVGTSDIGQIYPPVHLTKLRLQVILRKGVELSSHPRQVAFASVWAAWSARHCCTACWLMRSASNCMLFYQFAHRECMDCIHQTDVSLVCATVQSHLTENVRNRHGQVRLELHSPHLREAHGLHVQQSREST